MDKFGLQAEIAQLTERQTNDQMVPGSIPVFGKRYIISLLFTFSVVKYEWLCGLKKFC